MAATSTQYIPVDVKAKQAGVVVNPTSDTVTMAFIDASLDTLPASGDWKTASWETNATTTPDTYTALCLVGPSPGLITLVANTNYSVFVKLVDSPEVPVLKVPGVLSVF